MRIDVEKKDFAKMLPSVLASIEKADFITFDTELSGLCSHKSNKYFQYDDPQDRYSKLRASAQHFGLLQFGLGCFTSSSPSSTSISSSISAANSASSTNSFSALNSNSTGKGKKKFEYKSYGFYVTPSMLGSTATSIEKMITIQLSSFQFLAENNFDFNKAFRDAIPFISKKEEKNFRNQKMQSSSNGSSSNGNAGVTEEPILTIKPEDEIFLKDSLKTIQEWFEKCKKNPSLPASEKKLELPSCNSFKRFLLYQKIPAKFGSEITLVKRSASSSERKDVGIDLFLFNERERQEFLDNELVNQESQLQEAIGFRKVIDCIIQHGKPIVGHNCWLDLCHIVEKFIEPLPESLEDFLSILAVNFPIIYDTKHLFISKFKSSQSLKDINDLFKDSELPLGSGASASMGLAQFHDAAWDAYCTGRIFIGLANPDIIDLESLSSKTGNSKKISTQRENLFNACKSMIMNPPKNLVNHIHIMQSDYEYLNLRDIEAGRSDRSNLMVIYGSIPDSVTSGKLDEIMRREKIPMDNCQIMWPSQFQLPDVVFVFNNNDSNGNGSGNEKTIKREKNQKLNNNFLVQYNDKTIDIEGNRVKLLWWPEWAKTKKEQGLPSKRHYSSSKQETKQSSSK